MSTPEIIQEIARRVGPSVAGVGRGAGFVVGAGRVLTNAHNLRSREATVRFADGREANASLLGADLDGDLAVLEVATDELPALGWSSEAPQLGDDVVAVTATRNGPRVTSGRISASGQTFRGPRGRPVSDAIEHTAPLARGSSGSPVLGAAGQLLGINTHRRGHGFYLAVPAGDELRDIIEALGRGESRSRPQLGIAVAPPQVARRLRTAVGLDDRPGLLVRDVAEGSAAERAGIRRGDLIVAAADAPVTRVDDLFEALERADPDHIELRIVRGNEEQTVAVSLSNETRSEGSV